MENNSFNEIWAKIKKCKNIAMTLHSVPDGDSLGCCTAMKYILERDLICNVKLVSYDNVSENLSKLEYSKEVEFGKDISDLNLVDFDCVIFLDCGSWKNVSGKLGENFKLKNFIINIDHHDSNSYYGNLNYVDSMAPSACSVLVDFFKSNGIKFDRELSRRLLLGVCTDSGFFEYDSLPEKALSDAVFLIGHGADYLNDILRPVLYTQPFRIIKYFGLLFNKLKYDSELKCGYTSITLADVKRLGLNKAETRLGINELQFIGECDFVFNLIEWENEIKGSFRSKKGVNVAILAKELGGGGHKAAAAFVLKKMPLDQAEKFVLDSVRRVGIKKI
ncbi:MAG: DHH family phosphoesterase [Nanoarchaeota archaeon]|nr:DHH family phosphoesterase [Nanoarchaeota archaeon]